MKTLITAILVAFSFASLASDFTCKTLSGNMEFKIENDQVKFLDSYTGRAPSSTMIVTTKKINDSFSQTLMFEGKEHTVTIKDVKKLEPVEDYLKITSKDGHKIVYPIECQKA